MGGYPNGSAKALGYACPQMRRPVEASKHSTTSSPPTRWCRTRRAASTEGHVAGADLPLPNERQTPGGPSPHHMGIPSRVVTARAEEPGPILARNSSRRGAGVGGES